MPASGPVGRLLEHLTPRAGPLIVTVFGDAIAPRSRDIWLGSLIAMMAEIGLSERLVRTGVYRLARDGWLENRSRGRRSYYQLSSSGRAIFSDADARIYAASAPDWNGTWTIIQALPVLTATERQKLRDTLKWQGYGQLSPHVMVKPQRRQPAVSISNPAELAPSAGIAVFTARLEEIAGAAGLRETAAAGWDLGDLNAAYKHFGEVFKPFITHPPSDPASCFALRTLLIHEYRRILLKDPQLPAELLTQNWSGSTARDITARLYRTIAPPAEVFIAQNLENWDNENQSTASAVSKRFA